MFELAHIMFNFHCNLQSAAVCACVCVWCLITQGWWISQPLENEGLSNTIQRGRETGWLTWWPECYIWWGIKNNKYSYLHFRNNNSYIKTSRQESTVGCKEVFLLKWRKHYFCGTGQLFPFYAFLLQFKGKYCTFYFTTFIFLYSVNALSWNYLIVK